MRWPVTARLRLLRAFASSGYPFFVLAALSAANVASQESQSNTDVRSAIAAAAGPEAIGINQVGYRGEASKWFFTSRQSDHFRVLDTCNRAVYAGRITGPVTSASAGTNVWQGDFTALTAPGTYVVELDDGARSWPFRVGEDVYEFVLRKALRGLYVSRCGCTVIDESVGHPPCHMRDGAFLLIDGVDVPDGRDVSGAWHDGGDYWRSTMSAAQTVSRLMWPEELCPGAFDALPSVLAAEERIAGSPDLLTEARWGLAWLAKMQDADGGVSLGIAPRVFRMPGHVPPQDDPSEHVRGAVHSSNTAKVGAVFARAARVFAKRDPAFARDCLRRARLCRAWLQVHPQAVAPKTCSTYVSRHDSHDRLWLAVELFRTTGDETSHGDFLAHFAKLESPYPPAPVSTQTIRDYNLHEALISYCLATNPTDPAVRSKIIEGLRSDCDRRLVAAKADGYGCALTAADWKQRHTCGTMLQIAWELYMAYRLTGHAPYLETARQQLHYVLGANPLGKVYVTGIGSNPVMNPHYRPLSISHKTPPGLLVKGPTHDPSFLKRFTGPVPPPAKSYMDIVPAHQCNEPDIEVQAHLIGLAACFGSDCCNPNECQTH